MIGLANPWVIGGVVGALIASYVVGNLRGGWAADARCDVKIAEMVAETQKTKDAEAAKINEAAATLETGNAEAKVIYKTITRSVDRVVEKPIYFNVCLENDGLALANLALSGLPVALPPAPLPGMATGVVP